YKGLFTRTPLTADNAAFWTKSFAADVFLVVAVVPAIATFALVAARANRRDPMLGALIALAFLSTIALVALVSWFSATSPEYWRVLNLFYERYIFYLGPIFFTGLMAARGIVSTRAAAITSVIAVIVISGFQADALATPFSYESFGLTYLGYFVSNHNGPFTQVGLLAAGVSAVLALVYVASTLSDRYPNIKRYASVLAIALPMFVLAITQARSWSYGWQFASDSRAQQPQPIDFVARATDADVGMIVAKGNERLEYFQDELWNPNIARLYVSSAPPVSSPPLYTPYCRFSWASDGRISSNDCPRLPAAWYLRSKRLAMHMHGETKRVQASNTATLIFAPRPARISSFLEGRDPTTRFLKSPVSVTTFLDRPGHVRMTLAAGRPTTIGLPGGGSVRLLAGARTSIEFPVRAGEELVELRLPEAATSVRMISGELREGDGPWRSIT
ncbi:MAG: hypothetical protein ACRDKE_04080, partial [Solirubrobacterales bacterium]